MVLDHVDSAVHKLLDPGVGDAGLRGHLVAGLRHLLAEHGYHPHHPRQGDVLRKHMTSPYVCTTPPLGRDSLPIQSLLPDRG